MYQAIKVTFRGPTNSRGSRFVVSAGEGRKRMTFSRYDAEIGEKNTTEAVTICAQRYADAMEWKGRLVGGGLDNDSWVFVFDRG